MEAPVLNSIELVSGTSYAPGDQIEIRYDATDETGIGDVFFKSSWQLWLTFL